MFRVLVSVFLFAWMALPAVHAAEAEISMLHIAQRKPSEGDPEINSLGAFATRGTTAAHFDIVQSKHPEKGEAWSLEFAAGYLLPTQVNVYGGLGLVAGYRRQGGDWYGAYYPEAAIVVPVAQGWGVTASKRRYYKLFQEVEDVIMFGVVLTSR